MYKFGEFGTGLQEVRFLIFDKGLFSGENISIIPLNIYDFF